MHYGGKGTATDNCSKIVSIKTEETGQFQNTANLYLEEKGPIVVVVLIHLNGILQTLQITKKHGKIGKIC